MRIRHDVIASVKACAGTLLLASPLVAEGLIVRSYSVIDGLGSGRVKCIVADREGFFWVCTGSRLSRFDGSRFVTFGFAEGLPDVAVNHFLQTRSGSRWVATNGGGIARLESGVPGRDGRVFTPFKVGTTPRSMRVNVLFETKDGALLAGTDGGLFRARASDSEPRFELVPLRLTGFPDSGLQIWAMAEDGAGRTWVGTSAGLVLLGGERLVAHIPIAPVQGADHVNALLTDAEGRLWLGHDTGLFVWVPPPGLDSAARGASALSEGAEPCVPSSGTRTGVVANLPRSPGSACHWAIGHRDQRVGSLGRTRDGWIWMVSLSGLVGFDGARFHVFDTRHGLPTTALIRVAGDPGGDLWVGSLNGLHRIQRRGFTYFTAQDGLVGPLLERIFRGSDGQLYAVSSASVIHRFDADHWTAVRPKLPVYAGSAGRSVYGTVLLDREGSWWVGTGEGLLRFPAVARLEELARTEPVARFTTDDGLVGNDIWRMYEDSRGDIWISTRIPGPESLTRWERSTGLFHRYGTSEGLPAEREINAFAEDPSGALWASLWDGGLVRFDGRRFHYVAPGKEAPRPQGHLLLDSRGWLWVTGRQLRFTREPTAPEPQFETFQATDGRRVSTWALSEGSNGWLYAGTPTGVVRFQPDDGRLQSLGIGESFATFVHPHGDADGTLWFLSAGDILRYEPQPPRGGDPPEVRIGGVRIADVPLPVPTLGARSLTPLSLAARQRRIQVDYFGLGFGAAEPTGFQVRLDGLDDDWSDPSPERSAVYAGLGAGRYRFQVRAVSATGQVSAEPATFAFTIPLPLWRRAWFLAALSALFAVALVSAHRLRVRRVLELERIRTRIAADLHDDLGASLARVSLLSEATRRTLRNMPEPVERMLHEIGTTSRELVTAAGDIAFSIDPGRGRLDGLVARLRRFTEDLLAGTGIDWRFTVDGEIAEVVLSSDQRRHLLAIVKEALHNAVRHGRPRRVSLTLALQGDVLEAELADDGCGFRTDVSDNGRGSQADNGREPEAGHGLRNMHDRASELGARLEIASHPGTGTRVSLRCPLRSRHRMIMR